jgi:hypothetical protein
VGKDLPHANPGWIVRFIVHAGVVDKDTKAAVGDRDIFRDSLNVTIRVYV